MSFTAADRPSVTMDNILTENPYQDESDIEQPIPSHQIESYNQRRPRRRKGCTYYIANVLISKIDLIIRLITTLDLAVYIGSILMSLFIGIQRGLLIKLEMGILLYVSLSLCFF